MTPIIIASDPGSKHAGLVTRQGDVLLEYMLLVRHPDTTLQQWVHLVGQVAVDMYRNVSTPTGDQHIVVACEALNPPTPHMGMIATQGLLETAAVIGGLMRYWRDLVLVPPGGHGTGPKQAYPDALWGARERSGRGNKGHLRSAWDVAGAAATLVKMGAV